MAVIADIAEADFKLNQMTLGDKKHESDEVNSIKTANFNQVVPESQKPTEKSSDNKAGHKTAKTNYSFDTVIGFIEDMLIDEKFHELQTEFLEKYWEEFVDSEENKHSYMSIFMEYTKQIENFIETYLISLIPDFVMNDFITELEKRKDTLDGEVFEVLFTLTDFKAFKEMFLDYRLMKEGKCVDFGQSLCVSSIP